MSGDFEPMLLTRFRAGPARSAGSLAGLAWLALILAGAAEAREATLTQSRLRGVRLVVAESRLRIMDGDTAEISWSPTEKETVRVLGIDAPELFIGGRAGRERNGTGLEARGFARGAFSAAHRIELIRAATLDRYGRTLGYFFLDGRNYSVLLIREGLARETISRFGHNGFPREAHEVTDAAGAARRVR